MFFCVFVYLFFACWYQSKVENTTGSTEGCINSGQVEFEGSVGHIVEMYSRTWDVQE